jgi:predicted AAA+ superfamily ATPase
LVRLVAKERSAEWRSLDTAVTRQAAIADPTEFVRSQRLMVIDEVQRVPDLLLAIKAVVDTSPEPGRYLLTGSARVLGLRTLPDTLVGRMETIELWPFSQGEIDSVREGFVDAVFEHGASLTHTSTVGRAEYIERIVRGGFPEAVARADRRRRERFFDAYVRDLVARDVTQLSEIERAPELRRLLRLVAARSGQLLVGNALSAQMNLSARTIHRYLALLEEVFLIKRVPAWSRNLSTRAIGTPKVAFVDSGIAANLLDADARSLVRAGSPLGHLMEGFVLMELQRQLTWSSERVELSHYRTKDKMEVDAILENRRGEVVAIEVKASSTVRAEDFSGLRHLQARLGDDLLVGIVLYAGAQTLPFGPCLRAMPLSALWEVAARK